jgi:plastocyanin domain-containing protein
MLRFATATLVVVCLMPCACSKAQPKESSPSSAPVVAPADGGSVAVTVDAKGFSPSEVVGTKGAPMSLVFTRTSDNTCATEVVFPELKINQPLPLNKPVSITVPSAAAHAYKFQCGMAMYIGSVVIR